MFVGQCHFELHQFVTPENVDANRFARIVRGQLLFEIGGWIVCRYSQAIYRQQDITRRNAGTVCRSTFEDMRDDAI